MIKKTVIFLVVIIILGIVAYILAPKLDTEPKLTVNNFNECVSAGYPILESYPRQCNTLEGKNFVEDIGNELEKSDLVKVNNPRPNTLIQSPLIVEGEARGFWFFEASFPVKIFLLGIVPAQALGEWMTDDFVGFEANLPFAAPSISRGRLVLEKDNPSGLSEKADELIIPVSFKEVVNIPGEFTNTKIFLSDSRFADEPYFDCSQTIAAERQVPKSVAVAKNALEALLRGAKQEEIDQGFVSSINPGVRIQKLTIENGTAKVDFNEQLEFQVGGSCRVVAIRAQIIDTLKQFSTIKDVIISIDGRTEDILQP